MRGLVPDIIKAAGGDGWFPHYQDATAEMVALARARGLKVGAWTVNEPDEMKRLIELKLDAICTDRPDLLQTLEQRRRKIAFRERRNDRHDRLAGLFSGRAPTSSAAAMAAPEEMPTGMPSSLAAWRAVSSAVSLEMVMTSSITLRSRMAGTKPAPMP